jgi:hypothetical protein
MYGRGRRISFCRAEDVMLQIGWNRSVGTIILSLFCDCQPPPFDKQQKNKPRKMKLCDALAAKRGQRACLNVYCTCFAGRISARGGRKQPV